MAYAAGKFYSETLATNIVNATWLICFPFLTKLLQTKYGNGVQNAENVALCI
jgi:hypothetical protein